VYSITPPENMEVVVTTCGSNFDTKLQMSTDLTDSSSWLCNDDDRDCNSNTANSRVDASLEVGLLNLHWCQLTVRPHLLTTKPAMPDVPKLAILRLKNLFSIDLLSFIEMCLGEI
jgi:hypothetical protein